MNKAAGITWKNLLTLVLSVGGMTLLIAKTPADDEAVFPMPAGKTYVDECGSCHTAYAPGLLPARSWRKMMRELDRHFGEDASLANCIACHPRANEGHFSERDIRIPPQ